ncbi:hypothetical protein [Serpentinicella alkaliphila]|uniref:Uncharacterized protein n=1 Tax=Serpentinicella alkaliphila TaxID=1734049 RepID=A0A4R2T3U2_9FIRM|nr:hypothetical protein [Serpentinicella alkaliphila]QUH24494.1 hypothetical protein HZR23_00895 [Serpentinicella alkaliphila]TCP96960.1 hypothetical protein EDD79_10489 [Serpentinicella alkaliphila]
MVERYRSFGAWEPNPVLTVEGLNRLQDIMTEARELDKRVPHSTIVNTEFAKKAIE